MTAITEINTTPINPPAALQMPSQDLKIDEALYMIGAAVPVAPKFLSRKIQMLSDYQGEIDSLELGLKDDVGAIAFYESSYGYVGEEDKDWLRDKNITLENKITALKKNSAYLTYYFSQKTQEMYRIRDVHFDNVPALDKTGVHNCLIVKDGEVYAYPKIKPTQCKGAGQNHSSLNRGGPVDFAGELFLEGGNWYINNHSGHYQTLFTELLTSISALVNQNISLEKVYVEERAQIKKEEVDKAREVMTLDPSLGVQKMSISKTFFLVKRTPALKWIAQLEASALMLTPSDSEGASSPSKTDSSGSQEGESTTLKPPAIKTHHLCTIS